MCRTLGNLDPDCARTLGNYGPSGGGTGGTTEAAIIFEQYASGTDAGTFTSGIWTSRNLNIIQADINNNVSLVGNQFILQNGTYTFEIKVPAYAVGAHQARLQNISMGTTAITGSSEFPSVLSVQTSSEIKGQITILGTTTFEIQHRCLVTKATDGLGKAANTGSFEIYTQVTIFQNA